MLSPAFFVTEAQNTDDTTETQRVVEVARCKRPSCR